MTTVRMRARRRDSMLRVGHGTQISMKIDIFCQFANHPEQPITARVSKRLSILRLGKNNDVDMLTPEEMAQLIIQDVQSACDIGATIQSPKSP
jgi:hypothetical protein